MQRSFEQPQPRGTGAPPAFGNLRRGMAAAIGLAILAAQAGAWADLGARATAQYAGDGLSVTKSPSGAVWLRCIFQKLEGEATAEVT